ncbi:cytochrome c class I [Tepidimonas sp.]|uniref:c-type cytochrome n=1 Tax=Tepidimonas sp. TaxID=2002775 RepID=UPI0028CE2D5D|nr:cytochrome c class I [Tepidimonas sp.]MDT7928988.1 cytochrome c class I [Tepidimonas sp.]
MNTPLNTSQRARRLEAIAVALGIVVVTAGAGGVSLIARATATAASAAGLSAQATAAGASPAAATHTGSTPVAPAEPSPALNPQPVPADVMAHTCAACHGTHGQLGDEYFKPLAGMPVEQFVRTMIDFREGRRPSTLMGHVARGFTNADIEAMAQWFAAQPPAPLAARADKGAAS